MALSLNSARITKVSPRMSRQRHLVREDPQRMVMQKERSKQTVSFSLDMNSFTVLMRSLGGFHQLSADIDAAVLL